MEYLTVGTDNIQKELFIPVRDKETDSIKPCGGLWLTEYDPRYENYNAWVDYLINNPNVLFYKSKSSNVWRQPCSFVTLKDKSNIFELATAEDLRVLMQKYPLDSKRFSYELLGREYDGIYVDIMKLLRSKEHTLSSQIVREYCVSSLLLFNLECIDYYYPGYVSIEPFDFEYYMYEDSNYEIVREKVKKRVK